MSVKPGNENLHGEILKTPDASISLEEGAFFAESNPQQPQTARLLGQPEGPFGTACVSKNALLLKSLGSARFTRFETAEIAPHAFFVVVNNMHHQPYQAKSTLLEFQLFLGEPHAPGSRILKGIGRIEDIRTAVEVPVPSPAGYVFRVLQISGEELLYLENYVHELLLKAAM